MKHHFRKILIALISTLQFPSLTFAGELAESTNPWLDSTQEFDFGNELMQRLENNDLPEKYFEFLKRHNIQSIEELKSFKFVRHRKVIVEHYRQDILGFFENQISAQSNSVSFAGS